MIRELGEEVGLKKNFQIADESKQWLSYMLPSELKEKVWKGRYIGQKQKWFVCNFLGSDGEINLNTHKPEFSDWKWINPKDAIKFVVPFKKDLYLKVLHAFEKHTI